MLYDLAADRYQYMNLAGRAPYAKISAKLRDKPYIESRAKAFHIFNRVQFVSACA